MPAQLPAGPVVAMEKPRACGPPGSPTPAPLGPPRPGCWPSAQSTHVAGDLLPAGLTEDGQGPSLGGTGDAGPLCIRQGQGSPTAGDRALSACPPPSPVLLMTPQPALRSSLSLGVQTQGPHPHLGHTQVWPVSRCHSPYLCPCHTGWSRSGQVTLVKPVILLDTCKHLAKANG